MGEEKKGVKLFGMWASPFSLRVEWALKLKGVEYEFVNENLPHEKSPELLRYNPITKKIPTLVHDGQPLAESLVIIEYIDEVWTDAYPIMPQDPYHRSQDRFWAKFAEDKCAPATFKVYMAVGEELKKAVEEYQEVLRTLDQVLEGKRFLGGDRIGFLDLAVGFLAYWMPMLEELTGISIVNDSSLPLLHGWFHRFLDVGVVKESLPPRDKLYDFLKVRREQLLVGDVTLRVTNEQGETEIIGEIGLFQKTHQHEAATWIAPAAEQRHTDMVQFWEQQTSALETSGGQATVMSEAEVCSQVLGERYLRRLGKSSHSRVGTSTSSSYQSL